MQAVRAEAHGITLTLPASAAPSCPDPMLVCVIWALILGIEMAPGPAAPSLSLFLREPGVTFPVRHSLLFPDAKSFDTVCEAILKILKAASSQFEVSDMRALAVAPPSRSDGSVTNSAAVTTNTTAVTADKNYVRPFPSDSSYFILV